jgi:membrane associated rhomboid family serine protease
MRRRDFIALLGTTAAAGPLSLRAQQTEGVRRIGVLMAREADDAEGQRQFTALRQGLTELWAKALPFPLLCANPPCGWAAKRRNSWFPPGLLVKREPLFNIPPVVVAVLAVLVLIHAMRTLMFSEQQDIEFLLSFAFIPARYDNSVVLGGALPGGGADVWTFVTYALIHADWTHLIVNTVWLLPFGSAVARRFGALRFLAFFAVTSVAGAALHLATHAGEQFPMIGASAAISGTMAAAMRFAFQRGGPLGLLGRADDSAYRVPAIPLRGVLTDARVVLFLVVWFGINILFGIGSLPITGSEQTIAWQAHIGGFLAGLLLFSWFDPPPNLPQFDDSAATPH